MREAHGCATCTNAMQAALHASLGQPRRAEVFVRAAPDGRRATTGRRPVNSYEIRDIGADHPSFLVRLVCLSRFGRLALACA